MERAEAIETLRARIGRMGRSGAVARGKRLRFGLEAIDACLPSGLPCGALHEVLTPSTAPIRAC